MEDVFSGKETVAKISKNLNSRVLLVYRCERDTDIFQRTFRKKQKVWGCVGLREHAGMVLW